MFRSFNFDTTNFNVSAISRTQFDAEKDFAASKIISFFNSDGSIDAQKVKDTWFPSKEKYDVFISHAHRDEKIALNLRDFLRNELNLNCFIDSILWGNFIDLERTIISRIKNRNSETEKFVRANLSIILQSALTDVIDNSECLFFLNTENSIVSQIGSKTPSQMTESMWIFHEINTARIIRLKKPERIIASHLSESQQKITAGLEGINFQYPLSLERFGNINFQTLREIKNIMNPRTQLNHLKKLAGTNQTHALDILYGLEKTQK